MNTNDFEISTSPGVNCAQRDASTTNPQSTNRSDGRPAFDAIINELEPGDALV